MKRDLTLFIEDILENINLIEDSVKKLSMDEFESDRLIVDASLRRLEIIGEAVKNLPASFKKEYSEIPWKDISGFRDVVIHTYFGVVLERVWNIIKKDLPILKKQLEKINSEELQNA